jgi:flagellar transcriptional activator FlhC
MKKALLKNLRLNQPGKPTMTRIKSILGDAQQIQRAVVLIQLGARMQVLEAETNLSYERLLRLYKEVAGKSPSKGQLPFSTDWYMTWQPNIHGSLFLNIHEYLNKVTELEEIDAVIKAFKLYQEHIRAQGLDELLSLTRAWRLVKFVDTSVLSLTPCSKCKGHFVTNAHEMASKYVCGLCCPPARAGKGSLAGSIRTPMNIDDQADIKSIEEDDELDWESDEFSGLGLDDDEAVAFKTEQPKANHLH